MKKGFIKRCGKKEVERLIREHAAKGTSLNQFIIKHGTSIPTIRGFIKENMPGFEYPSKMTQPSDYEWLVNGSIDDTKNKIYQLYNVENKSISQVVEVMKAPQAQVLNFIKLYLPLKGRQSNPNLDIDTIKHKAENRFFSVHIVGSNPKALSKLEKIA